MPRTSLFAHLWLCLRLFSGHKCVSCLPACLQWWVPWAALPHRTHRSWWANTPISFLWSLFYSLSAGLQRDWAPPYSPTPPLLAPSLFLSFPPLWDMAENLREDILRRWSLSSDHNVRRDVLEQSLRQKCLHFKHPWRWQRAWCVQGVEMKPVWL